VREFTAEERRRRLISRQFLSLTDSITHATAGLVGLHATDPATPFLSLWARCPGFVAADLELELYQSRSVVRHLAMRRTLWVVSADDLPIIQSSGWRRHVQLCWTTSDGMGRSAALNYVQHSPRSAERMTPRPGSLGAGWFRWLHGC
jgi:hypothetical protein